MQGLTSVVVCLFRFVVVVRVAHAHTTVLYVYIVGVGTDGSSGCIGANIVYVYTAYVCVCVREFGNRCLRAPTLHFHDSRRDAAEAQTDGTDG